VDNYYKAKAAELLLEMKKDFSDNYKLLALEVALREADRQGYEEAGRLVNRT